MTTTSSARIVGLGTALVLVGTAGFATIPGLIAEDALGNKTINAFYCSVMTLTTVGYGDICAGTITSHWAKAFLVLLSFVSLGFFCGPVMDLAATWKNAVPGGPLVLALTTIGLGVAIFTQPMFADGKVGLSFTDAAYYSTITGTTIGYGDFTPSTDAGKIMAAIYSIMSVNVIGGLLEPAAGFLGRLVTVKKNKVP